jgi:hypothetical protein
MAHRSGQCSPRACLGCSSLFLLVKTRTPILLLLCSLISPFNLFLKRGFVQSLARNVDMWLLGGEQSILVCENIQKYVTIFFVYINHMYRDQKKDSQCSKSNHVFLNFISGPHVTPTKGLYFNFVIKTKGFCFKAKKVGPT